MIFQLLYVISEFNFLLFTRAKVGYDGKGDILTQWITLKCHKDFKSRIKQRFVSSAGNMEVLLSHAHSIVCALAYFIPKWNTSQIFIKLVLPLCYADAKISLKKN